MGIQQHRTGGARADLDNNDYDFQSGFRSYPRTDASQFARIVNAGAASFCFVSANANRTFRYIIVRLE